MKNLGQTCLLLDVDGVLHGPLTWRPGLEQFIAWAWSTFDLVCLLTRRQATIYKDWPGPKTGCGPCPPSLAWEDNKTEPLPGISRAGYRLFWAEDGVLQGEEVWCRKHPMTHYMNCRGAENLAEVKRRILRMMADVRQGG
mgnify:CR=1 FL=1